MNRAAFRMPLAALAAVLTVVAFAASVNAFTDQEIDELFKTFDANGDGKVDLTEYDLKRVTIIYRKIDTNPIDGVTFQQTRISRQFFDSIDSDHDGKLMPTEILDGVRFESITRGRGYFDISDFRRFMHSIER